MQQLPVTLIDLSRIYYKIQAPDSIGNNPKANSEVATTPDYPVGKSMFETNLCHLKLCSYDNMITTDAVIPEVRISTRTSENDEILSTGINLHGIRTSNSSMRPLTNNVGIY